MGEKHLWTPRAAHFTFIKYYWDVLRQPVMHLIPTLNRLKGNNEKVWLLLGYTKCKEIGGSLYFFNLLAMFMLKEHELPFLFLFKQIKPQTPVSAIGAILLLHSLFLLLLV